MLFNLPITSFQVKGEVSKEKEAACLKPKARAWMPLILQL